jgi:glycosyltransferase involved in cell wall biosynthesis
MGKNKNQSNQKQNQKKVINNLEINHENSDYPFVSICTPTFNRRPFIPFMIKCFEHQTYPKNRIEWIIIDDGTDKIGDLVSHIPQVKYYFYHEKMTLGKKRNLMHDKTIGDILIYMDDDDYYPPERISHAVKTLQENPKALCAGSSVMCIYFKHIQKMYQYGPYGPNHSTAAAFAFHRRLLNETRYNENACLAEEKYFLKDYTVPFVQLDPMKTILVFSHIHNSFDKKILLTQGNSEYQKESTKTVNDFVKEPELRKFILEDIEHLLNDYEPGKPKNKPDVIKQMEEMRIQREQKMQEMQQNQQMQQMQQQNQQNQKIVSEFKLENELLKDKNKYLEDKISKLIKEMIELKTILQNRV